MATTMTKIGRCFLAVVLSAFVCMYTPAMQAFAEEETVTNEDATGVTPAEPEAEIDPQADEVEVADTEAAVAAPETATATADEGAAVSLMALSADSAETDEAANPLDVNANPLDVGNFMELRDAFKYDINTQSGQSFVINLTDDITMEAPPTKYKDEEAHKWVFTMDTHNNRYNTGTDALCVKNGNTVTILGHGHSLLFTDRSVNNITPGTRNGNLILGAADGSDSLTFNFIGSNHQLGALVDIVGGTLAVHSGVTLSNNVNFTAYAGGAICATNGAVVTMDGGLIENCSNTNITWGGGVNVDGATFNMIGGTIKGCSETAMGDYLGFGGGVSLGASGYASTFNMSGNAVIEGNSAPYGGGVYVGPNSTFNMSGNAAITGNTGSTYGGGVYVAQSGTFAMSGNASVTGNDSPYGGGVLNFGTATVTNVYDNDASVAGADIYNNGTLTMDDVHEDWSLSREQATSDLSADSSAGTLTDIQPALPGIKFMSMLTMSDPAYADETATATVGNPSNKNIDGWYYDGHRETGETDENGNAVVERNRWNANEDTADTPQYLKSYVATGQPTTEVMGLKAAHGTTTAETPATVNVYWENDDGAVLFELDKVEAGHVPEATEYNALSGQEDPTEPGDANHEHEFEGWERTDEPNGDVVYMAMYDDTDTPVDPTDPQAQATDPEPDPDDPTTPDEGTQATEPEKTTEVGSLHQTGDKVLALGFGLAAIALFSLGGLSIAKRRASKN